MAPTLEADAQKRLVPPPVVWGTSRVAPTFGAALQNRLVPPVEVVAAEADGFGSAVALSSSGEYAAVGAPYAYVRGTACVRMRQHASAVYSSCSSMCVGMLTDAAVC